MFASFFLLDVMTKTCSFICLCLLFRITSFDTFLGFSFLPPNLTSIEKMCLESGKVGPVLLTGIY